MKCLFRVLLFLPFLVYLESKNPIDDKGINFDGKKFITLGPPRNGSQRAVFDEVPLLDIDGINLPQFATEFSPIKNDFEAYDDKVVDLLGEDPLFIPKIYRTIKQEEKVPVITGQDKVSTAQTSASSKRPQPLRPQPPPLPTKPIPREKLLPQSTSPPSRIVTETSFKPNSNLQRPVLVPRLPEQTKQQQHFRTKLIPLKPTTIGPQITVTTRSNERPLQQPSQINFQQQLPFNPDQLRTGVCHASLFYITTPMRFPRPFTHFAITVSVDQCARTCHEFNCAVADYDPITGHCQFNPTTAFAVREGQCPPWPATHYKNNVETPIAIRIFCLKCRKSFQRGRTVGRANFKTSMVKYARTGRSGRSIQNSENSRVHSANVSEVIAGSSLPNITAKLKSEHGRTSNDRLDVSKPKTKS